MAKRGSKAWKRNIAEGTKRGMKRSGRISGVRLLPRAVRRHLQTGEIAPALRQFVNSATNAVGIYAEDLTGDRPEDLTAAQKIGLAQLHRVLVAEYALYSKFLRDPSEGLDPQLLALGNAEIRLLGLLGLKRKSRRVPQLEAYVSSQARGDRGNRRKRSPVILDCVATPSEAAEDIE